MFNNKQACVISIIQLVINDNLTYFFAKTRNNRALIYLIGLEPNSISYFSYEFHFIAKN